MMRKKIPENYLSVGKMYCKVTFSSFHCCPKNFKNITLLNLFSKKVISMKKSLILTYSTIIKDFNDQPSNIANKIPGNRGTSKFRCERNTPGTAGKTFEAPKRASALAV